MTLATAWIRRVGNSEELIVASDSRLRGGEAWDSCPKILELPRGDCAIAFAGDTERAYPLMLQVAEAIRLYPGSLGRSVDISDVKGHGLRVFEQMLGLIDDFPVGHTTFAPPVDTEFIFGGFSWRHKEFRVWVLHFDKEIGRYTFRPIHAWKGQDAGSQKIVAFIGDKAAEAKARLRDLLHQRHRLTSGSLEMEPFEVLRDMIRSGEYPTIGGAPQLTKVYQHMSTQTFGVCWPDINGQICVKGRPALEYEKFAAPYVDPDRPNEFGRKSR